MPDFDIPNSPITQDDIAAMKAIARIRENGGAALIRRERERQIMEEGRTPEHDAIHAQGDLVRAGALIAAEIDRLQAGLDS